MHDTLGKPPVSDPWLPDPWLVTAAHQESWDTATITIEPQSGHAQPPQPGQFSMLYAFGVGEVAISFSAINEGSVCHTIRAVGKVSNALSKLQPGAIVGVRGPFGSAWRSGDLRGREIIVLAGGVGLAPLKPLIDELCRDRDLYAGVHVLYGARDPDNVIFASEVDNWQHRLDVQVSVDSADLSWQGNVGFVMSLLDQIDFDPARTTAFVCGPEIMMRLSIEKLTEMGVDPDAVFLSMERNMKCAIGFCGHCQYDGSFICREGPVYRYPTIAERLRVPEL